MGLTDAERKYMVQLRMEKAKRFHDVTQDEVSTMIEPANNFISSISNLLKL